MLVRRISATKERKSLAGLTAAVTKALVQDQDLLYAEALAHRQGATADVGSVGEAVEAAASGWARIKWAALGDRGEAAIADQGVSVRCLLRADGGVPERADEPELFAIVGRSY